MSKKNKTKKEAAHLNSVAILGCIACSECLNIEDSPAECHHITTTGLSSRASHCDVIPLCPTHHRTGNYGVAIHAGRKIWEVNYMTERALLEIVKEKLNIF